MHVCSVPLSRLSIQTVCLGLLGLVGVVLASCSAWSPAAAPPPPVPGASFVGNRACLECHQNITRVFPSSPHGRLHFEGAGLRDMTGCESCHGPGSKHVAAGGGRGVFIVNPGKDVGACYRCHNEVHAQFNLPQHHPLPEGRMNCAVCHDPHGMDIMKPARGLAMARANEQCAQCHREQARLFVFEHEASREGCIVCHQPHGSINAKMLVERDNNLCLKCHAQIQTQQGAVLIGQLDHTVRLRQGTCWSAGCHSAVHGSNIHPRLLY